MTDNKPRILFVDDEPRWVQLYVDELMFSGFEVTMAQSADKAIKLLDSQTFDLVILDIMMPPGKHFRAGVAWMERSLRSGIQVLPGQNDDHGPIVIFTATTRCAR